MLEEWPECPECGDEVNPRRIALGYPLCLECGEEAALKRAPRCDAGMEPAFMCAPSEPDGFRESLP